LRKHPNVLPSLLDEQNKTKQNYSVVSNYISKHICWVRVEKRKGITSLSLNDRLLKSRFIYVPGQLFFNTVCARAWFFSFPKFVVTLGIKGVLSSLKRRQKGRKLKRWIIPKPGNDFSVMHEWRFINYCFGRKNRNCKITTTSNLQTWLFFSSVS
jgi:hypothetical protein